MRAETFIALDRKDVEHRLGRNMKWRERLAFGIAKRKVARQLRSTRQDGSPPTNGMAIAGFAIGMLTILTAGILGFITGPLGLIFSLIGLNRANRRGYDLRGLAIAGIVIGALTILLWVAIVGIFAIAAA
jgi:hypothetical protein